MRDRTRAACVPCLTLCWGGVDLAEAVFAGVGRLGVRYNGAKSAKTVPRVFSGFQNSINGARGVFEIPKLKLAVKTVPGSAKVLWHRQKWPGTVIWVSKGRFWGGVKQFQVSGF
jgi:hypothetical protein